jgi:L-malate glycosyltransferase
MSSFTGRVTHLVSGDLWGGAEAFVYTLASQQHRARRGSVSCVIMNPGQLADELTRSGIPTLVLDEARAGFGELLRSVQSHVQSFRPHVLHAHRQKENLIAFFSVLGKGADASSLRRVTTVHGMPEPLHRRNLLRAGFKRVLNSAALHVRFHAIVGVSHDIARRLQTTYSADKVVCIHNGVVVPEHVPRSPISGKRPLRLLALGRLVPIKRFDRLKELSEHITNSPLSRPHITLAGDGPLRQTLQTLFEGDASSINVQMPGFVRDTGSLLRDADALVMTSDHEGIPMAVLEALASGVPVFGFRVGGLPEIAAPGLPLFLTPLGDIHALALAIATYFAEHELGTRVAPPNDWSFDIRSSAQGYDALYSRLCPASEIVK